MIDAGEGRIVDLDRSDEPAGERDDFGALDFHPNGLTFVALSIQGHIREYSIVDAKLRKAKQDKLAVGTNSVSRVSARFSPDGRRVAIGSSTKPIVTILAADDLKINATLEPGDQGHGHLGHVAWTADGTGLVAGGGWAVDAATRAIAGWRTSDWKYLGRVGVATNTLTQLLTLSEGGILYSSGDPGWGRVTHSGEIDIRRFGATIDMRGARDLALSEDGTAIAFPCLGRRSDDDVLEKGESECSLDLISRSQIKEIDKSKMIPPRRASTRLRLEIAAEGKELSPGLIPIEFPKGEKARNFSFDPDDRHVVVGTDWKVRYYEYRGNAIVQLWETIAPGTTWGVNISQDKRWVVSAFADGTIRWYTRGTEAREFKDGGREVLALFPLPNRKDWVLWTPEGFYAASSPEAEAMVGFHLNRGRDQEGEFISAAQLREHFYDPNLVSARLGPDGDRRMEETVRQLGAVQTLLDQARSVPPAIELLSPEVVEGESEVTLSFRVLDRGGGVGALKFYVDGQPVEGRHSGVSSGQTYTRTFALSPGRRTIEIAANSRGGGVESARKAVAATISGARQAGTLHILAVGVETYQDPALELKNSVRDAEKVADELAQRARPLFTRVAAPRVLKNEQATLAGIRAAFAEMHPAMKPEDTLVIFLAGHGQADVGSRYSFLPWDFRRGTSGALGEGLNEARLFEMLDRSPAKTLLLIDSCEAGGMVEWLEGAYERIGGLKRRAVIGASRRGELAREGYEGHGVFTAALLQALRKTGDGSDEVTVPGLYDELRKGVRSISSKMPGSYLQSVKGFLGAADFSLVRR